MCAAVRGLLTERNKDRNLSDVCHKHHNHMRWAWEGHIFFSFYAYFMSTECLASGWGMKMREMLFTFTRSPQLQYVPAARVRLCGCVCVCNDTQSALSFSFVSFYFTRASAVARSVWCAMLSLISVLHLRCACFCGVFAILISNIQSQYISDSVIHLLSQ